MGQMMVGRPRPDLIDRCRPPIGSTDHALFGLSTVDICTNTNRAQLDDGFKVSLHPRSTTLKANFGRVSQVDIVLVRYLYATSADNSILRRTWIPRSLPRGQNAFVRPKGSQSESRRGLLE